MNHPLFCGTATALVTPFDPQGNINTECLHDLIEFQLQNRVSALVIAGTTGEGSLLSFEEYGFLIAKANEYIRHRVPLIAGSGSNSTQKTVKLSLEAQKRGADALLLTTPYYNKTTQQGLVAHYQAVAERVSLPIILYNIPSRTGQRMNPDTLSELSEFKNVVGLKEADSDVGITVERVEKARKGLFLYSGNDDLLLPHLALGAKGIISVASNIIPREIQEVYDRFKTDPEGALTLHKRYWRLIRLLFKEPNPIPIKKAMELLGFGVGEPRLPLLPCSFVQELKAELRGLELI